MLVHNPAHIISVVAFLGLCEDAMAGFNPSGFSNLAIYWGQNSYQQPTGQEYSQQRLAYYCSSTNINIIPLAFLDAISSPTSINFANAGDNCTVFSGTTLLDCPQLEEDIQTCQSTYGKTILLSIGGATYTEGGFSSPAAAKTAADKVWAMFGPAKASEDTDRPFGKAVVDGFDFDLESSTTNMAPFASELRAQMDAATAAGDKTYYLSAAPQCPYPDAADNEMLDGAVAFDFVMVQFYNNFCGLQSFTPGSTTQSNFDLSVWDTWAKTVSKNPDVRILMGIPGGSAAAGSGYESGTTLSSIITFAKQFSSFGGIMIWDMSQVFSNKGFLEQVVADLVSETSSSTTTVTTKTTTTATSSFSKSTPASSNAAVVPGQVTCPTSASRATSTATISLTANKTTTPSSTVTSSRTSFITVTTSIAPSPSGTSKPIPQWGQCGGEGYTGSAICAAPYSCVQYSKWWAQCK